MLCIMSDTQTHLALLFSLYFYICRVNILNNSYSKFLIGNPLLSKVGNLHHNNIHFLLWYFYFNVR